MNSKIIFESKSRLDSIYFYIWLALSLGLIAYLSVHFLENPILIAIVILFYMFIVLGNSRDKIIITDEYFEIVFKRLIPVLSTSRKFIYKDIERIEADLPLTQSRGVLSSLVTATAPVLMIVTNTIAIQYRGGRVKKISTNIYRDAYHEAFDALRRVSNIQIEINDIPFS